MEISREKECIVNHYCGGPVVVTTYCLVCVRGFLQTSRTSRETRLLETSRDYRRVSRIVTARPPKTSFKTHFRHTVLGSFMS